MRFYREYAGGDDLNAFRLRDTVYFGRFEDGVLENEFSGNLVEICPTGVFTDATLKQHYTRKWDLQMAPSVCVHCSLGCNTTAGERYGLLRRIENRYNHELNGYFLCDRGRFGYEFVNSGKRIHECQVDSAAADSATALDRVATILQEGPCIGIGSPRASIESNFALRQLVGEQNFYAGVADNEWVATVTALETLRNGPAKSPSLDEVEHCDAVLVLGEDVTNVAPILALRLRQSVRQQPMQVADKLHIPVWLDQAVREATQERKGPLFIATPYATKLDDVATQPIHITPDEIARLGFAVAHAVDETAPSAENVSGEVSALVDKIAAALRSAKTPLIVSGTSCRSRAIVEAAAQVAWALCRSGSAAKLSFCFAECNSAGLALMNPRALSDAFKAVDEGHADTVIVLENDLFRRATHERVAAFLKKARHVVALDHLRTQTTENAEIVLPSGTFAETDGTLVNNEGRAQRFFEVFVPGSDVRGSWRWLGSDFNATGACKWNDLDEILAAIVTEMPALAPVEHAAPLRKEGGKVARDPNRYSGRTSMLANISVHEPKPPQDPDSALAFSMESGPAVTPPALNPFFWAPGWNSIQSVNKFQREVGGPLRGGDPGVRLIEPTLESECSYFAEIPAAFNPHSGDWLFVPAFHIFGSEELSSVAPAIAQLAPRAYAAVNTEDGALLGIRTGDSLKITIGDSYSEVEALLRNDIPAGMAAIPSGMAPALGINLPAQGKLVPIGATLPVGALK